MGPISAVIITGSGYSSIRVLCMSAAKKSPLGARNHHWSLTRYRKCIPNPLPKIISDWPTKRFQQVVELTDNALSEERNRTNAGSNRASNGMATQEPRANRRGPAALVLSSSGT
jgi:hypothetical protein